MIAGIRAATATPVAAPRLAKKAPRGISEGPVGGETQSVSAVRHETVIKKSLFMTVGIKGANLTCRDLVLAGYLLACQLTLKSIKGYSNLELGAKCSAFWCSSSDLI